MTCGGTASATREPACSRMVVSIAETAAGGPSRISAVSASTKIVDGLSSGNRSAFSRKVCPVVRSCSRKVRLYGSACCKGRRRAAQFRLPVSRADDTRRPVSTHTAQSCHKRIELSLKQIKGVDQVSLSVNVVQRGPVWSAGAGISHRSSDSIAPQPLRNELCISYERLARAEGFLEAFREDASEVGHVRCQG